MQLSARIRPRDLEDFFSAVGKIRDVRLITDPRTKRSKGIAYIEFRETDSVPLAIALTGQRLLGVPIIVKLTQAEKNRMPFTGPHIPANVPQSGPLKLYIGNLNVNITEEMLKGIFEPFGEIDAILLARNEMGYSRGFGFIQFSSADDGRKAMEQMNNFELAGKAMKVSLYIAEKGFDNIVYVNPAIAAAGGMPNAISSGSAAVLSLDKDELDRAGVNLGASGKLALMAKLAEGTGLKLPQNALNALNISTGSAVNGGALPNTTGLVSTIPTQCFVLSNMFDLEE
jgi:RNA-binding protein 39